MAFSTCQPWKQETHSTASAAYSRHRQEHPAVALGIKKQQTQGQGTLPDNGGETTDRPKSDRVTGRADLPCPSCEDERGVLHQRGKGVSLARGECGGAGPPQRSQPLSLASLSPRREVKAVWPSPSFGTNGSSWTHGLKGDNLPDILEEDNISNTDVYSTEIIYRKNVLLLH